jgi:motility quorum-sensing regulator / GCU-specific mRNA interferase toxin
MGNPTYPLSEIRNLISGGCYRLTASAMQGALAVGFDDQMILDVVMKELGSGDFYKTMESEQQPGLWQDVYKLTSAGVRLYVRLQIQTRAATDLAVVISFKEDTSGP